MNEQYDEYNEVIKQLEAKCKELENELVMSKKRNEELNHHSDNLRSAIGELSQENESMKAQVIKVVRGQFSQICSYCGWEALASGASWDELQVHIKVCPKHPLTKAIAENANLQQENQILIEELKEARAESGRFGVGA